MSTPLFHVDAFTDRPFEGSPAAVCVLARERDDAWLQQVAREMNLSETAFLIGEASAWRLRWFTPAVEVELCGHATLSAAHILWETGRAPGADVIRFDTSSGVLSAARTSGGVELDFPSEPAGACPVPGGVLAALGIRAPRFTGKNRFDYLVEVEDERAVRVLTPDFRALREAGGSRGVIVTARSDSPGQDFVSRFFAPSVGIDEDPVTGSAHCCLGPHWAERLSRTELTGYQASSRGGVVRVRIAGPRVFLGVNAVTVARGEIL
jgi:predicted PhzF superfamily epimerase YddE/YHI9